MASGCLIEYISPHGFVMGDSKEPGMNDWLITGVAVALNLYPGTHPTFDLFNQCRKSDDCPLIYRGPDKKNSDDTEKADDYWAAMLISNKYYQQWSRELLTWAEVYDWTFNVQDPESKNPEYRFDRFLGFAPLLRLAAGEKLSLFDTLQLMGALAYDCWDISKGDGNMKALCRITLAERSSAIYYPFAALWRLRIRKKYGRIALSFQEACGVGYGHPILTSGV